MVSSSLSLDVSSHKLTISQVLWEEDVTSDEELPTDTQRALDTRGDALPIAQSQLLVQ